MIIKAKKHQSNQLNFTLFTILITLILVSFFILKESNFSKQIPDIVEIPKEVQESIKNVKPQKSLRVPILMYHYVEYVKDEGDTIRKSLNIVPFIFDQQVKTLKDAGFSFITTADLADALDNKASIDPKSVILTFDDGYRDFYTDVFPILKKYQVKAVVYIVPNFLDRSNNLTSWQLKEIAQSGLVEIGAHTMDHTYLSGLPLERVEYEIKQSKEYFESNFGIKVVSFAYPYGAFDNQIIDVVKKAGFKSAVTAISGIFALDVNRFFLYRVRPGVKAGESLLELFR
ncbi:MAG: polysaccharide deacetylase family protein [Candidatus Daviesbacteria bacterium]|nr:polysaccharide deacetylase family protein [Candidatus Daviesbacteria bacterium]